MKRRQARQVLTFSVPSPFDSERTVHLDTVPPELEGLGLVPTITIYYPPAAPPGVRSGWRGRLSRMLARRA